MEPLANKIRPQSLKEFVGQEHLVGVGKPLRKAIDDKHLFSFVLWGPPGTGKTTIARIYAKAVNGRIYELSAVSAGKDDIRKIIEEPDTLLEGRPKVLFLDEIHRFNKAQQDFLLPYVESGRLTLIGATTENPSFEIIPALLSRCRVFVLKSLTEDDLHAIVKRTKIKMPKAAEDWLVGLANGDARIAITAIENCKRLYGAITLENLKNTFEHAFIRFDKKGEEHYDTISAYIKSMRAGDADAAIYYLARMIEGGEDPKFIARRIVIAASEDVGNADPQALVVATAAARAVEFVGLPECRINLAQAAVYVALAPKSDASYRAIDAALAHIERVGSERPPVALRDASRPNARHFGHGEGYRNPHRSADGVLDESLLPDGVVGTRFFIPGPRGVEAERAARLTALRAPDEGAPSPF